MVSITSKRGIKAFFRGEDVVVVQHGGMELSIKVGANMEIKCTGKLLIEAGSIEMKTNVGEVAINSAGNLDLTAEGVGEKKKASVNVKANSGTMTLQSQDALSIASNADLRLEGMNTRVEAASSASMKGNSSAELLSSGSTVIKGAMVLIN
jgi:hypothetical protein